MARAVLLAILLLFTFGSSALAVQLTAKIQNESGKAISAIRLTAMNTETPTELSVLTAPVPAAQTADIALEAEGGFCVFAMSVDFADGTNQARTDVDLCEPSYIIVE